MIFRTKIRLEQKISKKIKFIILQLLKVDFFWKIMKLWHHVFLQLRTYVLIEAFHLLFPSKIPNDKMTRNEKFTFTKKIL